MAAPPPPPRGGMSLYANLLDPTATDSSASISSAPVVYGNTADKDEEITKREANSAALRFQPIRRPQLNQKKPTKPSFPKTIPQTSNSSSNALTATGNGTTTTTASTAGSAHSRTTLADWAAVEEDEYMYSAAAEKRPRGGRRKNKKKKFDEQRPMETDWDELYDPARPTNVEEYLRSDERIRGVQEWKAVLYAHRRRRNSSYESNEDSDREMRPAMNNQFAPPGNLSFAPPPQSPPPRAQGSPTVAPPPDETAEEAYARRLALSGMAPPSASPPPPPPEASSLPPPPPDDSAATIARGPVHYEVPPQPAENDDTMDLDDERPSMSTAPDNIVSSMADDNDPNTPRSNRPGQAGFAKRLMSKYGWTAGSGLGADASGIINPLRVQVEKRRKRPDSEGGGFVDPAGRGKIIGGKRPAVSQQDEENTTGKGAMSEVIVLRNMLEGMDDLQGEITDGGLGQEIGEECGDKYGRVERLYIDVGLRLVFIKFTDQVSALRAVNALEGRIFNGNAIVAKFYDMDKFERGVYI